MKPIQFIIIIVTLLAYAGVVNAQAWNTVGTNDSNWASFHSGGEDCDAAYNSSGVLYVVHVNHNVKLSVRKFINGQWQSVGSDTFSKQAYYPHIAFGANDTPYITYCDVNGPAVYAQKFNGSKWVGISASDTAFIGSLNDFAEFPSISTDVNGVPYISFIIWNAMSGNGTMHVMKFTSGIWAPVGTLAGDPNTGASITITSSGVPFLFSIERPLYTSGLVRKWNGTVWVTVGSLPITGQLSSCPFITVDKHDTVYIAYTALDSGGKAVVKKFNGTSWLSVGAAQGVPTTGYNINDEKLVFDVNNTPYLSFTEIVQGNVTLKKFVNGAWVSESPNLWKGREHWYTSIAADPTGGIAQVYYDRAFEKLTAIKYQNGTADYIGDKGINSLNAYDTFMCTTIDTVTGTPYVLYIDPFNNNLVSVKKYSGGAWSYVGGNYVSPYIGAVYAHITCDNNGVPYILYVDNSGSRNATIFKLSGNTWSSYTNSVSYFGTGSIFFDKNNRLYKTEQPLGSSNITAAYLNGNTWVPTLSNTVGLSGKMEKVVFDKSGTSFIMMTESVNGIKQVSVATNNVNVHYLGQQRFTPAIIESDIAIDSGGIPYIVFTDANYVLSVMKYDGSNWVYAGNARFNRGGADSISIAFDPVHNVPYVSYIDGALDSRLTVQRLIGKLWQDAGKPALSAMQPMSKAPILFDNSGNIYAVYRSGGIYARGNNVNAMCIGPDTLELTSIAMHNVDLKWNVTNMASDYQYTVVDTLTQPVSGTITATNTGTVSGLKKNTYYNAYVRGICGNDTMQWQVRRFKTPDTCITMMPSVITLTDTSALIDWSPGGLEWKGVEYRVDTIQTAPISGQFLANTGVNLYNLTPNTTYYFHIRFICDYDTGSWITISFTTKNLDVPTAYLNAHNGFGISVYPNPASTIVNVKLYGADKDAQVFITDLAGKTIMQEAVNSNEMKINISDLPKGLYILKYISGSQQQSVKLVKD